MTPSTDSPTPRSPSPEVEELSYNILILQRMIKQLPGRAGELLLTQLTKVLTCLNARDQAFLQLINTKLDDTILSIKVMEFDLEATRRERDQALND